MKNIRHNIRKTVIAAFVTATATFAATLEAAAAPLEDNTIYVNDRNTLYKVDEVTGIATVVAEADASLGHIEDLAFDGSTLYGLSGLMESFRYNATTSKMESISDPVSFALQHKGLEAKDGIVYAAETRVLQTVNPEAGTFDTVGVYGLGAGETVDDLAFDEDGTLYAMVSFPGIMFSYLGTIDTSTGEMTLIGNTTIGGMRGITVKDGVLYGISSVGDLFSISKVSGLATRLHGAVVHGAYGMETSPADLSTAGGGGSGGGALSSPVLVSILVLMMVRLFRKS